MKILFKILLLSSFIPFQGFALNIEDLVVPDGFSINIFEGNIEAPRQMAQGDQGFIFVGSRKSGKVIALHDSDGNGISDSKFVIAENLNSPNGVSFYDGDLYIAEIDKIWKIRDIEQWLITNFDSKPKMELVTDDLPSEDWHGSKWLKHDIEGNIYTSIGAPCNVCLESDPRFATIVRRINQKWEIIAKGVRNSVGFDWHPKSNQLYFTDNGRDWLGDHSPPCELNRLERDGQFFGFPFIHGKDIKDPLYGEIDHGYDLIAPIYEFDAHSAPLGLEFYDKNLFPDDYKYAAFVAVHGSWNRTSKIGYKVVSIHLDQYGQVLYVKEFITGFLKNQTTLGRPVAPLVLFDGSLLISDDYSNQIYRVSYQKPKLNIASE